jgi:beta-glucosidase
MRVIRHLLLAHGRAYQIIHELSPGAETQVGVAHHMRIFDPYRPAIPYDRWLAALVEYIFNRCLLGTLMDGRLRFPLGHGQTVPEVARSTDFLGLNYYTRDTVGFQARRARTLFGGRFPVKGARSVAGWEIYPEGLYRLLRFLKSFGKPILITENGVADDSDELRPQFLLSHLAQVHRAVAEGVPVEGYLHWSSMDNFEWAEGYSLRFGLVHVDFATQERTVKPSGWLYSDICARGAITASQIQRYAPELLRSGSPHLRPALGSEGTYSAGPGG